MENEKRDGIIEEKTLANEKNINKIFKCLFGSNGSSGGLVSEMKVMKSNLKWVCWLLGIQIVALVGNFFRSLFTVF